MSVVSSQNPLIDVVTLSTGKAISIGGDGPPGEAERNEIPLDFASLMLANASFVSQFYIRSTS